MDINVYSHNGFKFSNRRTTLTYTDVSIQN